MNKSPLWWISYWRFGGFIYVWVIFDWFLKPWSKLHLVGTWSHLAAISGLNGCKPKTKISLIKFILSLTNKLKKYIYCCDISFNKIYCFHFFLNFTNPMEVTILLWIPHQLIEIDIQITKIQLQHKYFYILY